VSSEKTDKLQYIIDGDVFSLSSEAGRPLGLATEGKKPGPRIENSCQEETALVTERRHGDEPGFLAPVRGAASRPMLRERSSQQEHSSCSCPCFRQQSIKIDTG
jgi:hypothetical protein